MASSQKNPCSIYLYTVKYLKSSGFKSFVS